VLDHAIFFSLGDLGKALPKYEEIALPVELDIDLDTEYDRTRQRLKDYLIARRWEGDTTFRGAYLQWAMGWLNAPFRPYEVIHNLKHPITGMKEAHIVASIPSYGEQRIYAKEQALIDLVCAELAAERPCVIYFRQTATRDIQPRLEGLIRQHVPDAKTFILSNTVAAERREAVIEREIAKGTNVVLCNPELVKTGLDLIYFPTLIFFEIVFNLSTMMQAAARSYRLNQNHAHCKVYYLFAEGTMEQTAVQLMSRKQRAAKLLTGEIGLTGLDALTEGEGGFEEALMEAIGRDETLLDPTELFKAETRVGEIDLEDAGYWNFESASPTAYEVTSDPAVGVIHASTTPQIEPVEDYLETVHLVTDEVLWAKRRAELRTLVENGSLNQIAAWLVEHQIVFPGYEREVAAKVIAFVNKQTRSQPSPIILHVEPSPKPEKPNQRLTFPRREPIYEEAVTHQLALF
jgi:hypothetical protein